MLLKTMASSSISFSQMNVQDRKPSPIERRPKLLKDFLDDHSNSCSSSGFKSFPRQQPCNPKIVSKTRNPNPNPRVASKLPKQHTISAFQALINAVKNIPFNTVKSSSFLPRSLSRRLSKRDSRSNKSRKEKHRDQETENEVKSVSVKVKDILRWTSFRDLVEEMPPPLDFSPSDTTGSIDSCCNSDDSRFSWCEGDFTAEFLPACCGNSDEKELEKGKKEFPFVGLDSVVATTETANCTQVDLREGEILLYEEDEQQSPVSVFDFQISENEEPFSAFDETLANVERTRQKLIQKINQFESLANLEERVSMEESVNFDDDDDEEDGDKKEKEYGLVEERARELLVYVKATSSALCFCNAEEDQILLDFFREELRELKDEYSSYSEYNLEAVNVAKAWINGEHKAHEWGLEYNIEAYIREMHKNGNWSKFEVETEELILEIGDEMLGQLIDGVLVELILK